MLEQKQAQQISRSNKPRKNLVTLITLLCLLLAACIFIPALVPTPAPASTQTLPPAAALPTLTSAPALTAPEQPASYDKMLLWQGGTQLRGANLWQRRVFPELDGYDFLGDGYMGPPVTQQDFDALAALGANYVNLSHAGLFSVEPPYVLDEGIQANLDKLIGMAQQADLFVVITFRTGPGRSEFTFNRSDVGDWLPQEYLIETVWEDAEAQQAWAEMWRYTAQRYRGNPVVVGYDLMCEPNASDIVEVWDEEDFYRDYGGSLQDWQTWYPQILSAIREVDTDTPVLVGAEGYSHLSWLPSMQPVEDDRLIYTFHQYAPSNYAFQSAPAELTYPGFFDTNWDGTAEEFNRAWLEDYLNLGTAYAAEYTVPLAVNEYGVDRWVPGVEDFIADEMELFEQNGWNYAIWAWDPAWEPWTEKVNALNFRMGADPQVSSDSPNALQDVLTSYWARNTLRPSVFSLTPE